MAIAGQIRAAAGRRPCTSVRRHSSASVSTTPTAARARVVGQVIPTGPAAGAGLAPGDVITSINGQPVNSATALTNILDQHHPGDNVHRRDWRDRTDERDVGGRSAGLTPTPRLAWLRSIRLACIWFAMPIASGTCKIVDLTSDRNDTVEHDPAGGSHVEAGVVEHPSADDFGDAARTARRPDLVQACGFLRSVGPGVLRLQR